MNLILMRHGVAEEETASGDDARPLTRDGRHRARGALEGLLHTCHRLDLVITSPKLRATQTADLVKDIYGHGAPPVQEWTELAEGAPPSPVTLDRLRALQHDLVLVVGHEPHLSQAASVLLTGTPDGLRVQIKKAGALMIEVQPGEKRGRLVWSLMPKMLRGLGK